MESLVELFCSVDDFCQIFMIALRLLMMPPIILVGFGTDASLSHLE
jgi:hypothetical protein